MTAFDHSKLLGRMREMNLTQEETARKIGITDTSLRNKLKGRTCFTQGEIFALTMLLDIDDVRAFFFTPVNIGKS